MMKINRQQGFSLLETLLYLMIMGLLLLVIASVAINVFNTRRQFRAADLVQSNGRFIINLLNNKVHNVDLIDDVSPAPEGWHFYQIPDKRFSLKLENNDLVYQEVQDTGTGFPEQSTAEPVVLNNDQVAVSDFAIDTVADSEGNANQGVLINFTLTVGQPEEFYGYYQKQFEVFFSLR